MEQKDNRQSSRLKTLFLLVMDFFKKCTEDHIAAFGAMSAFFILLSAFPFLVIVLTLAKSLPYSKENVLTVLSHVITFQPTWSINQIIEEVYRKTGTTIFTASIIGALWSSSKGIYSLVLGLNSVYDIEDNRNYFILRALSTLYTFVFLIIVIGMMFFWIFGNKLYQFICGHVPILEAVAKYIIYKRLLITSITLTILFMLIYRFIPNRKSEFRKQLPGALLAMIGWLLTSWGCSFFIEHFSNFTLMYGSMAGIMMILIWLYFCMSMIFYGAEFNYFLENKKNYHALINSIMPAWRRYRRERVERMRILEKEEREAQRKLLLEQIREKRTDRKEKRKQKKDKGDEHE